MGQDDRAAKLAVVDPITALEPVVARDLDHPHFFRSGSGVASHQPSTINRSRHDSPDGGDSRDVDGMIATPPLVFAANSAGAFVPSIVNAPPFDNHFARLNVPVEQQREQLAADEICRTEFSESLVPESCDVVNNTSITSSSSSSPPPTRFHFPLITTVPKSESTAKSGFDWAGGSSRPQEHAMFFGEFRGSGSATRRRMATSSAVTEYEADLTSKDRLKQKEAIRRLLAGKVKNDWDWSWPQENRPTTPVIDRPENDAADPDWHEREDWTSTTSDSEDDSHVDGEKNGAIIENHFRFDNPDTVGHNIQRAPVDRKTRRRRRLLEEMLTNNGVACFTHRRNAWTRARHVRIPRRPKATAISPVPSSNPNSELYIEEDLDWEYVTEIPIAPPILPPETPLRKGISEKAYATIYDKVISQSQTPFCPINLSVVVRSCVEGWKRDGEWPPRGQGEILGKKVPSLEAETRRTLLFAKKGITATAPAGEAVAVKDKGVFRRSLQRVFGVVHGRRNSEIVAIDANGVAEKDPTAAPGIVNKEDGDVPVVETPVL